jgi:TPR repeat protein
LASLLPADLTGNAGRLRRWIEQALKLGNSNAMLELAVMLRDGVEGPVDIPADRRLLMRAAEYDWEIEASQMLSE